MTVRLPVCVAALALVVAGCGSTTASSNSAVTVSGSTLTIYASEPPGDSGGQVASDVLDAERLAFSQSGAKVGQYHLRFAVAHGDEVSADARKAVSDQTSIAYLGEIGPGTSGVSVQITNELGLLQVSPTDTAIYLTHATPAVKGAPRHFYPSHSNFGETFARVAPTTAAEAKAIVARIQGEGIKTLAIDDDGSQYGASIAQEVRSDASAAGLTVASTTAGAGAVFFGGLPGTVATHALDAAATAAPHARLFAPSALYDEGFVTSFQSHYHHTPAPQAIFGYEAMRAVIAALRQAGTHAAVRQAVVADFRSLKRSAGQSAIGAYTMHDGDISIAPFVFATVSGGRLVPRAAG